MVLKGVVGVADVMDPRVHCTGQQMQGTFDQRFCFCAGYLCLVIVVCRIAKLSRRVNMAGTGIVRDFANFRDFETDLPRKQKHDRGKNNRGNPKKRHRFYFRREYPRTIGARSHVVTARLSRSL